MKAFALGLALTLSTLSTAHASDWLFFDQEERFSIEFPTTDVLNYQHAVGANDWVLNVEGPITIGVDGHYATDGAVQTRFFGGDTWYFSFSSPTVLPYGHDWLDGYVFDNTGPTAGAYREGDDYYIQDDPRTWTGYHDTKLVVCNTDTPGCSVAGILAAPEPSVWALMMGGIGLLGGMLRVAQARRREEDAAGALG